MGIFEICCGEGEELYKDSMWEEANPQDFDNWEQNSDNNNDDKNRLSQNKKTSINVSNRQTRELAVTALAEVKRERRVTIYSEPVDLTSKIELKYHPKTNDQYKMLDKTLQQHFLFDGWTPQERQILIQAMEPKCIPKGEKICQQDGIEDLFYIVEKGMVTVYCETYQHSIGNITPGNGFGELEGLLLYQSKRAKSCIAETDCTLWTIDQSTFRYLLAQHAQSQQDSMQQLLSQIDLFRSLDNPMIHKLINALTIAHFEPNEIIVQKGEPGMVFYIIQHGEVLVHDIGMGDSQSINQVLGPNSYFGERALITGEPRAATITAQTKVTTACLDRETFETIIGKYNQLLIQSEIVQTLQALPIFANSPTICTGELKQLASFTQELCFPQGTKLAEAGKPYEKGLNVWMIKSGRLLVYSGKEHPNSNNGNGGNSTIYNLKAGDYFGDKSIRGDENQISSHTAICEENLTVWVLSKQDIESVLGSLDRLGQSTRYQKQQSSSSLKRIRLQDLQKRRILGHGGFGKVWLVHTKTEESKVYALKVISKRKLLDSKQEKSVLREKDLLSLLNHPFILHLEGSFQDAYNLYLLLPLIQGGELFHVMQNNSSGLSHSSAAFYAACVLEALGHFHHRHIAYRDLKLENVLIDTSGYCTIVDLGFAKVVIDKTFTLCGTPEYLAPEVILSKGHNHAADYWSFGVLLYELLQGRSPFYIPGSPQLELFKRIILLKYTPLATKEGGGDKCVKQDLVSKLLVRRPADRLGNLSLGTIDIRNHPFFKELNFKRLLLRQLSAPWIPKVTNPLDSSNFVDDYRNLELQRDHSRPLNKAEQEIFKEF